ncbi:unnamed protein product [Paramecium sonneborni]|uniref:Uncharacterized protein n=1 Tax=Paramecium sonneborni TaxID=65129 RepID=A0A8S1RUL1_9CILI|nr:unnamed protein product [Paramecium sonneborni]
MINQQDFLEASADNGEPSGTPLAKKKIQLLSELIQCILECKFLKNWSSRSSRIFFWVIIQYKIFLSTVKAQLKSVNIQFIRDFFLLVIFIQVEENGIKSDQSLDNLVVRQFCDLGRNLSSSSLYRGLSIGRNQYFLGLEGKA